MVWYEMWWLHQPTHHTNKMCPSPLTYVRLTVFCCHLLLTNRKKRKRKKIIIKITTHFSAHLKGGAGILGLWIRHVVDVDNVDVLFELILHGFKGVVHQLLRETLLAFALINLCLQLRETVLEHVDLVFGTC